MGGKTTKQELMEYIYTHMGEHYKNNLTKHQLEMIVGYLHEDSQPKQVEAKKVPTKEKKVKPCCNKSPLCKHQLRDIE